MEFWEDYEILRVETPENLDLYLPLAGFGPRFLAFLVDTIFFTITQVLLGLLLIGIFISLIGTAGAVPDWVTIVLVVCIVLLILLVPVMYFMVFESMWGGQSPGKRLTGIRVVRRGGFPVGRREILWRNVLRLVDMLPSSGMVGLVSFFATKHQQRLGDLVADTVVIREFTSAKPYAWAGAAAAGSILPHATGTLTPALSYVIGSYLQRARQMSDETRAVLSRRCIEALGYESAHLSVADRENYLLSVMRQSWAAEQ